MKKKVLIISGIRWCDTYQRHHIIANMFLKKGYDVCFLEGVPSSKFTINKALYHLSSLLKRTNQKRLKKKKINNLETIHLPFLNPEFVFFNKIIFHIYLNTFKNVDMVYTFLPIPLVKNILKLNNKAKLIYDCVRDFESWGGYSNALLREEKKIINLSDSLFVDSFYILHKNRKHSPTQFLPSISDELYMEFSNKEVVVVDRIKNIAYFGTLDIHMDVELLLKCMNNGFKIHFFGLKKIVINHENFIDHGFYTNIERLLNDICFYADATLIPYIGNMNGVIPAKLMQSLLLPIPVFCSSFYDSEELNDYLYVYKTHEDFFRQLERFSFEEFCDRRLKILDFVCDNLESKFYCKFFKIV